MNKKSKRTFKICVIALCAVIIGSIALSAIFGEKDIYIEYDGMKTRHGTDYIVLNIENNTGKDIVFEEDYNSVIVSTDEGSYYLSAPNGKITDATDTVIIDAEDLEGDVEKVEISKLLLLDEYDSTDAEMNSIVVYDEDGTNSFSGDFTKITFGDIFSILFFIIFIGIFVIAFAQVFLTIAYAFGKKGKYINLAHNSSNHQDEIFREANRLHEQAHQNAHNLHVAMHEMHTNSFNDMVSNTMFMNM